MIIFLFSFQNCVHCQVIRVRVLNTSANITLIQQWKGVKFLFMADVVEMQIVSRQLNIVKKLAMRCSTEELAPDR